MTRTLNRLSDRLLALLVPKKVAAAGCVTDPYDYWGDLCYCSGVWRYYQRCHVYSNCTVSCTCKPRTANCY